MNPFRTFKKILETHFYKNSIKELEYLWNKKDRYYHNTDHLIQIIKDIENDISFKLLDVYEKHILLLAAFTHDAIYDPKKKDNENQSIYFFKCAFKTNDTKILKKVCDLIEVTKYRKRPTEKLERIFWNADNAKFKDGYKTLLNNEMKLRKEFSFLSSTEYKEKRIEFLKSNFGLFNSSVDKDIQKLIDYIENKY